MSPRNDETRQRLLQAATMVFADRGFKNASVREICDLAGAALASIHYHFHDKLGLYKEVISTVADSMDRTSQEAMDAAKGATPEERLRNYIRHTVRRVIGEEKNWLLELIGREMADPSPAFGLIVDKGIIPNGRHLAQLVSEVCGLPANDPRTLFSAGMVHAQCFFLTGGKPLLKHLDPNLEFTAEYVDEIARQIAEFSLAGIRALARRG